MKSGVIKVGRMLVGAGTMLTAWFLGRRMEQPEWGRWLLFGCVVSLVFLYGCGIIGLVKQERKKESNAADEHAEALRYKRQIEQDPSAEQTAIAKMEKHIGITWIATAAAYLLLGLFAGMSGMDDFTMVVLGFVGAFFLSPVLTYGLRNAEIRLPDPKTRLYEQDYPMLFSLVRDEAKRCGYDHELRIFLGNMGIGVFHGKRFDGLLLPPLAVRMLTKNEFRQALRHEFAHLVSGELELERRWLSITERRNRTMDECGFGFMGLFPILPAVNAFEERFGRYREFIENRMEAAADIHELSEKEARDAVAAIAKAEFFALFNEEDRVSSYLCYESEASRTRQTTIRGQVFDQILRERGRVWLDELETEQPAPFASHPTFGQRKRAYGVMDYNAFSVEEDAQWAEEMNRLCELENRYLASETDYEQTRQRMYLERRACMELYENADDPWKQLQPPQIIEAAEAYFGLNTPKAIAVLKQFLQIDSENPDAKLLLGVMLLDERNSEGIEVLYQVAEHKGYEIPALSAVSSYVYRRGNAEAIVECERRCMEILQGLEQFQG